MMSQDLTNRRQKDDRRDQVCTGNTEVDQKMWPRRGKKIEEVEPVKKQRRGSCWWHAWEAVQLRARREGLSRLRHKGATTPEAKPGESAGFGLYILDP